MLSKQKLQALRKSRVTQKGKKNDKKRMGKLVGKKRWENPSQRKKSIMQKHLLSAN